MKLPTLRLNPKAALEKSRADRAVAESKLADLQRQRQAALADSDDIEPVRLLDDEISRQRRTVNILNDRTAALAAECRRLDRERREKQRDEAIARLEKNFSKSFAAAKRLEQAVDELGNALFNLLDQREKAWFDWPAELPRLGFDAVHRSNLLKELGWAMYAAGRPTALTGCKLPAPNNMGLGVAGISPKGIAASVEQEQEAIIALLKNTPLSDETEEAA